MKTFPRFTVAVAVALSLAGMVGAARANPMMGPGGGAGMTRMCADMDARMAARSAYMEVKLGLSDAQKADFKALNETMKAASEPMKTLCAEQGAKAEAATPPAHMAQMRDIMKAKLTSMDQVIPAMTRFYDGLSPDQKKIADAMMAERHGSGHGGMHH